MGDDKTEQEAPMEEILASIRRIISESDDPKETAQDEVEEPAQGAADDQSGDVLELTQMIEEDGSMVDLTKDESDAGAETESDPESGLELADDLQSEPEESPAEEPATEAAAEPTAKGDPGKERLVSADTADAAVKPFADLARAADPKPESPKGPRFADTGRTVEDLVMELMRPMLREWLDENLPDMVERLVQKEIRYLVRRAEPD